MTKEQFKVMAFHRKAGATINICPTMASEKDGILRCNLIAEELDELDEAMAKHDLVEIADALGDLLYVVYGTAVTYGIDMEPIFNEIHSSNMSKFIDGHLRSDGKWIKGPSYKPANLLPILEAQLIET